MNNKFYTQIEVFAEIVRQGTLTAAASALRTSKSSVSQKLADLEADLDVKLFSRTTRTLELTHAGTKIYERCAGAVDSVAAARSEVGYPKTGSEPEGVVNVSGPGIYLTEFVLPELRPMMQKYPKIRTNLIASDHVIDQKRENIDLRIRVGPVDRNGVRVAPLQPLRRILCCSASLGEELMVVDSPKKIAAVPVILREQENPVWVFKRGGTVSQCEVVSPEMIVNSYDLCVRAIRSGLGVAVVAKSVVQADIERGEIVEILPDWEIDDIPVSIIAPYSRLAKPQVRVAFAHLNRVLK